MADTTSSAGTTVKNDQRFGTSAAKTQNPQDLATSLLAPPPVLTADPSGFGPLATTSPLVRNLLPLDTVTTPDPNELIKTMAVSAGDEGATDELTNDLMRYSTYTYTCSFEVAKPTDINSMVMNREYDDKVWIPLIKTGGLGTKRPGKGERFKQDFYIDNLRIRTILGITPVTRTSNAVTVEFTIVEPYGVSFIEELFDFVHNELGQKSYIDMCYLLKIDFIGYTEDGKPELLTKHRKYIPIRLTNLTFSITASGAVYEVVATPFNHWAMSETYGRVTKEISAEGKTLREFASVGEKSLAESMTRNSKAQEGNVLNFHDVYKIEFIKVKGDGKNAKADIGNCSLTDPKFAEQKDLIMAGAGLAKNSRLRGVMKEFASAQFLASPSNSSKTDPKASDTDPTRQVITFNAGSAIIDVLENLIKSSSYITSQIEAFQKILAKLFYYTNSNGDLTDKSGKLLNTGEPPVKKEQEPTDKEIADAIKDIPVYWFRIIPIVTYRGEDKFDPKTNRYAKEITYKIIPYTIYSNISPVAGHADPEKYGRVIKDYQYIYTGKNTEILNFDIKFDMSYFTMVTYNSSTQIIADTSQTPSVSLSTSNIISGSPLACANTTIFTPNSEYAASGVGAESAAKSRAGDLASSLYNPTDLIRMSVEIFGDPDYIQQDEFFFHPVEQDDYTTVKKEATAKVPSMVLFNSGEIYYRFTFFTPQDYNNDTGLMNIDADRTSPQLKRNMYSGLYKIIVVDSVFSGGTFKQTIDAIRLQQDNPLI